MYSVTVSRQIPAQHYLTVPDPGPEGDLHTHEYNLVVELSGPALNQHGYLVDITTLDEIFDRLEARYANAVLNELPEINGNPSAERFAEQIAEQFIRELNESSIDRIRVTLWEDDTAAGSFERSL